MRNELDIEKVEQAFKVNFTECAPDCAPSAKWRDNLLAELNGLDSEQAGEELMLRKCEERIWRAGWISFAASLAALLLFSLIYLYFLKQSFSDRAVAHVYNNIMIESEL